MPTTDHFFRGRGGGGIFGGCVTGGIFNIYGGLIRKGKATKISFYLYIFWYSTKNINFNILANSTK